MPDVYPIQNGMPNKTCQLQIGQGAEGERDATWFRKKENKRKRVTEREGERERERERQRGNDGEPEREKERQGDRDSCNAMLPPARNERTGAKM